MAYVIVGASLAGANAAETLRAEGFTGDIVMIGEEPEAPYERPPLSKGYLLGDQELDSAFVHPLSWYQDQQIDLRLSTRVTQLDPGAKTVKLASGEQVGFEKALIATGARPRRLNLRGNVHYLRTLADSKALKQELRPGRRVVVVGAGWIGLEVAAAARKHGADVVVVEKDSLPLRHSIGDELGMVYRDLHLSHGVQFQFGRSVVAAVDDTVALDDGTSLPADVIVIGVGVKPETELAVEAGLDVDNGILVSDSLQTSAPDIYACGDVANWQHPLIRERIRVEHWENARQSGMAAAKAMLGQQVSYDWIPYFYSDQYDVGMEYSGWMRLDWHPQVVFRGSVEAHQFAAFWVKEGRIIAGMNVNIWDVQDSIRALVRQGLSGTQVDPAKLANQRVAFDELLT